MAIILVYAWFISSGSWTTWDSPTRYYTDLARGFQLGHLYLARNVSPRLLASPDPYNANTAGNILFPLDLSYFDGKYYLAFGPVPALLLVFIHWLSDQWLGDLALAFILICGLYLVQACLSVLLWHRYFPTLPKWTLWVALALIGLAGPVTFMLDIGRSARVYEAAISAGQFFFLCGLLSIFMTMASRASSWGIALAGVLWALAIGSRLDLLVPIGFATVIVSVRLLWTNHWSLRAFSRLMPLALILVLAGAVLAWYNWARFGSPWETGYYYQLSTLHLQQNWNARFSLTYVPPNLYTYLVGPPTLNLEFPYLHANYVLAPAFLFGHKQSDFNASQWITGVLWMAPFVIFAITAAITSLGSLSRKKSAPAMPDSTQPSFPHWIGFILLGGFASAFAFLLLYFWVAMRFLEDFLPALMLLSIIGFWQGYQLLAQNLAWRHAYTALGVLLATWSVTASLLLGVSALTARIQPGQLFSFWK
jgi:hypothetical protein